jgi:hypothetical protein
MWVCVDLRSRANPIYVATNLQETKPKNLIIVKLL